MPTCGKSYWYRLSMYNLPEKRTCTLDENHTRRCGQKKAERPADAEPSGTCQICFRTQQTSKRLLVKHGYKRPGWGYTIGECWGCRFQPFEVSCERTKAFIVEVLRPTLARVEASLTALQARPETLTHEGRVWVGHQKSKSGYQGVSVKVVKGEEQGWKKTALVAIVRHHWAAGPIVEVGDFEQLHHPSYDVLLKREIAATEGKIRMVKSDIASYEKAVAEWKPVPWPAVKAVA